jgi:cyclin-C
MATAQVYLKRFYSRVEIRRTNPYLVITTAVYLACKMEEAPQHIRLVVTEARTLWSEFISLDTSKVGECEFFLISEMSSQLLIHQPYRTLLSLRPELPLTDEDVALTRSVINDAFMTDLPMIYSPHTICLVAIMLAVVLRPGQGSIGGQSGNGNGSGGSTSGAAAAGLAAIQATLTQGRVGGGGGGGSTLPGTPTGTETAASTPEASQKAISQDARLIKIQHFMTWLSESQVDIAAMVDATQEMISFYECFEQYNDKLTREQINRFVKARGLDK